MNLKRFSLLLILSIPFTATAQNIWGANATEGQSAGQFADAFNESVIAGSYAPDSWTALSVSDTDNTNVPGLAFWTRSLTGLSEGGLLVGLRLFNHLHKPMVWLCLTRVF